MGKVPQEGIEKRSYDGQIYITIGQDGQLAAVNLLTLSDYWKAWYPQSCTPLRQWTLARSLWRHVVNYWQKSVPDASRSIYYARKPLSGVYGSESYP